MNALNYKNVSPTNFDFVKFLESTKKIINPQKNVCPYFILFISFHILYCSQIEPKLKLK